MSKNKLIVAIGIMVALTGGTFLALTSTTPALTNAADSQAAAATPKEAVTSDVGPTATTRIFRLIVSGRKIISGPATLRVIEGDNVTLKVSADESEELHLHGYDRTMKLEKDVEAELTFAADLTGRFPIELEMSRTHIGNLEVLPE